MQQIGAAPRTPPRFQASPPLLVVRAAQPNAGRAPEIRNGKAHPRANGSPASEQMMMNHDEKFRSHFSGTLVALKERIAVLQLDGTWHEQPNGVWRYVCGDRAGLLWSATKGTIWFDGPQAVKDRLAASVGRLLPPPSPPESDRHCIYLVHGAGKKVCHRLRSLPNVAQSVQLLAAADGSVTDKLPLSEGRKDFFVVALATPEDIGLRRIPAGGVSCRSSQDLVMQLGVLHACVAKERCLIIRQADVKLPSLAKAMAQMTYHTNVSEAVPQLLARLRICGFAFGAAASG